MGEHTHVPIPTEGVERPDGIKIYPSKKDKPPHNGKPIIKLEISPNGKYVVTYSENDKTIIVWNVKDDEGRLKPDHTVVINHKISQEISQVCVSDEKKIVYITKQANNYKYSKCNLLIKLIKNFDVYI